MHTLFTTYEQYYQELEQLPNARFPRALRAFNIRFRLALDLVIDYNGPYAYVKTKAVKETYIRTLRLMDLWNAYEALIRYGQKELGYHIPKAAPSIEKKPALKQQIEQFFERTGALSALKHLVAQLQNKATTSATFQRDFGIYTTRIQQAKNIENSIKLQVAHLNNAINGQQEISGIEALAIIYAERNLYYHNGEQGKMGITYSHRKWLLDQYHSCLCAIILHTIIYILREQIKKA